MAAHEPVRVKIWKIPGLSLCTFPEADAEGGSAESRHHLLLGSGRSWWALFVLHLPQEEPGPRGEQSVSDGAALLS